MFYKFSQIRRNDSQQSSQFYDTFWLKLDCSAVTRQTPSNLSEIKITIELNDITKL